MRRGAIPIPILKRTETVTTAPAVPDFDVEGLDAAIELLIHGVRTAKGYRRQLRRWNTNRWGSPATAVDIGTRKRETITRFNASNAIENNRRHQVRVQAYNDIGSSAWSGWEEVTPLESLNPPTYTFVLGVNQFEVSITAPASGVTPTIYAYEFEQESEFGGFEIAPVRELGADMTSINFTQWRDTFGAQNDLVDGNKYRFRMQSKTNDRESDWGEWIELTYKAFTLTVPTFRFVGGSGLLQVHITSQTDATAYGVQIDKRNDADDGWVAGRVLRLHGVDLASFAWTDSADNNENILSGRKYRARVNAQNDIGTTEWSDWKEATTT